MRHALDLLASVPPPRLKRENTEAAYAVLDAMTAKERYAFDLAVTYRCDHMAQVIWDRARARVS